MAWMIELQKILELIQQLYSLLQTASEMAGRRGTSLQIDGAALLRSIEDVIELAQQDMQSLTLQMRQYEELVRTTALITSTHSLSEVLESVTDTILKLTHAERTYLMILDQDTQQLQIQIARNWDQALIPDH